MADDLDFIIEQFAYAVAEYTEAKRAEEKAREESNTPSWGYHGQIYFERIDRAKSNMTEKFKNAVQAIISEPNHDHNPASQGRSMNETVKTLEGVKVGDKFMVYSNHGWVRDAYLKTVICEKVTNKQCVVGGQTYRIADAKAFGSGDALYPYTAESVAASNKFLRRKKVENFNYQTIDDEQAEAIYKIIARKQ